MIGGFDTPKAGGKPEELFQRVRGFGSLVKWHPLEPEGSNCTMGRKYDVVREKMLARNPKLKAEYDKLGPRYEVINALISARRKGGLSQSDLARRMGVQPNVISRLESAEHSPRLDTLVAAAAAIGCDLRVQFVRRRGVSPPARLTTVGSRAVSERKGTDKGRAAKPTKKTAKRTTRKAAGSKPG